MRDGDRLEPLVSQRPRVPRPPLSSLADGAAGVAYALLRYASLAGDGGALPAAHRWIRAAQESVEDPGAFTSTDSRVFPQPTEPPPSTSVVYGAAGVWWVAALVAHACGDHADAARATARFTKIAESCPPDRLEVMTGAAGLLLAAAALVEAEVPERLQPLGEHLSRRLAVDVPDVTGWLGAAHGWAGIAHARLRWCRATGSAPDEALTDLIARLAAAELPSRLWPRRAGGDEVWPGWCGGSAGWVQLWTLAHEVFDDPQFLLAAERAGEHAVAGGGGAGLCCGAVGEAFAAIALHNATGEPRWTRHAERLAGEARDEPPGPRFPEYSLWRGNIGAALLAVELEQPKRAAMPLCCALA